MDKDIKMPPLDPVKEGIVAVETGDGSEEEKEEKK